MGNLKDAFETTNGATEVSKTAFAVKFFVGALLVGLVVAVPLWYVFGVGFFKVMGVWLALTALSLFSLLDGGWFGSALYMMVLGLIVAVPVWLVFGTGFVTVLTVSVALGLLYPWLKGREYREAARQRQQQAMLGEPEHQRPEPDQVKSSHRPDPQGGGGTRNAPTRPHELRAMPYKEYLQTPHWKRKREEKVRAAGLRCQLCNRGSVTLNVHHRTYERLGEELEEDLTVLCHDCHSTFHEHRRLAGRTRGSKPADLKLRTVVPGAESAAQKKDTDTESGMEKHTVSVGTDRYGETVTFTAKKLGTAEVNGGNGATDGADVTFYRLPDDTYRALGKIGEISLLAPSNFLEVLGTDQPATYGRWTFEEAKKDKTYGEFFTKFMQQHPEGRKRTIRDLD